MAVKKKNPEIVHLLLKRQDIDCNMKSLKQQVKRRYHYDVTEKHEKAPLHQAVKKGYIKIVQLLLNHQNIDVNLTSLSSYDRTYPSLVHVYYIFNDFFVYFVPKKIFYTIFL